MEARPRSTTSAPRGRTLGERRREGGRGEPAVPAEQRSAGRRSTPRRRADPPGGVLVELSGTTPRTSYALKMRSRSGDTSPHGTEPARRQAFWTTMPITDCSGTLSPSRCHHFVSQTWHVVNARSRPLTDIEIVMRSSEPQVGQLGVCDMTPE